jgi:hypothetical protein
MVFFRIDRAVSVSIHRAGRIEYGKVENKVWPYSVRRRHLYGLHRDARIEDRAQFLLRYGGAPVSP